MKRTTIKKFRILLLAAVLVLVNHLTLKACEACNQNQPKILRGITHGSGPQSNWDYFIVVIMVLVTLYSFYATVKCFVKPTEKRYDAIKNTILNH